MASLVAYFMSGSALIIAVLAITASIMNTYKFTSSQHRSLLAGFIGFGFLAWLFAYLGGI